MAASISIPFQVALMHKLHPLSDLSILISQIETWGWLFMGLSLLSAYFMITASKHLAWAIPILCAYTTFMNFFAVGSTPTLSTLSVAAATIAFYLPFGILFLPQPSKVLRDPEKKWWAHPERKRVNIPMIIDAPYNQAFSVSTYDISLGGAYIRFDEMNTSMNLTSITGPRSGLKVGDLLNLKLHAGRFSNIYCQGRVVRLQKQAKGKYPQGIGIQFLHMKKRDLRKLKMLLKDKSFTQRVDKSA